MNDAKAAAILVSINDELNLTREKLIKKLESLKKNSKHSFLSAFAKSFEADIDSLILNFRTNSKNAYKNEMSVENAKETRNDDIIIIDKSSGLVYAHEENEDPDNIKASQDNYDSNEDLKLEFDTANISVSVKKIRKTKLNRETFFRPSLVVFAENFTDENMPF
jgi:hypothetical protein